jgi:hypothetical protein
MKHYGDSPDGTRNTIHASGTIDIQTDKGGKVLAVWFRCLTLPFRVSVVEDQPVHNPDARITAVEYEGEL